MSRWPLLLICFWAGATTGRADTKTTNLTATAILQRVLAHRPLQDFSLKARLFVTRDQPRLIEVFIQNLPDETRAIYRAADVDLLTIQPAQGAPRLYRRGIGELTPAQQMETLFGSQFSYYDLSFPFLHWPQPTGLGEERTRGRDSFVLAVTDTNQPYARVKMWIDKEFFGLVRAEAYNADGNLVKRYSVTSLKRIGDYWMPRGIEIARVPAGQALPSEERSRLEIYEGNYATKLPAEWFLPEKFGTAHRDHN